MEDLKLSTTQTNNLNFLKVFVGTLTIALLAHLTFSHSIKNTEVDFEKASCKLKTEKESLKSRKS